MKRSRDLESEPRLRLALAGGGTGGHVLPGRHLLRQLAASGQLEDVLWLGAGRGAEERALAGLSEELIPVRLTHVRLPLEPRGGGAPSPPGLLLRTPGATLAARRALGAAGSRVLLGLGGFTNLPAVLAARSLGLPVALLEINAVPGKATRLLGPMSQLVAHAWQGSLPRGETGGGEPSTAGAGGERHRHFGPPLAPEFASAGRDREGAAARELRARLGFDPDQPLLVVLGGSQGARALNEFTVREAPRFADAGLSVLHQVGPGRVEEAGPATAGYRAEEYLDDVAGALAAATLVLARAGASTVAEIAATRAPAFLVPYPHHADRHQERNALELGDGARIVPEAELGPGTARELVRLACDASRSERQAMSRQLGLAIPSDGAQRLAEALIRLAAAGR